MKAPYLRKKAGAARIPGGRKIEKTRDYTVMSNYHLRDMSPWLTLQGRYFPYQAFSPMD